MDYAIFYRLRSWTLNGSRSTPQVISLPGFSLRVEGTSSPFPRCAISLKDVLG